MKWWVIEQYGPFEENLKSFQSIQKQSVELSHLFFTEEQKDK